jgi:hypothetical protein
MTGTSLGQPGEQDNEKVFQEVGKDSCEDEREESIMPTVVRLDFFVKPIFSWMTEIARFPLTNEQLREVEDIFVTYFRERLEDRFPGTSIVLRFGVEEFPPEVSKVTTHSQGVGTTSYEPYAVVVRLSHSIELSKEMQDRNADVVVRAVEDQFPRIYQEDYVVVRDICLQYAAIYSPVIRRLNELAAQERLREEGEKSS